jgi:MinD superfamily P-loop ATPase
MIRTYCSESGIAVIGEIPFSRKAAQIYSRGQLLVEDEAFKNVFENISLQIRACLKKKAGQAGVTCKL